MASHERPNLGIRANLGQFTLLVVVNALVGAMVGSERTVLPLLAEEEFGIATAATALTFIVAFGVAKAAGNLAAGVLADRWSRKRILVAGWWLALPIPVILITADAWWMIVAANVLLGLQQGLTWSSTVIMKIDLAGPHRRGLAMGLNESAGYVAVAVAALATGAIASRFGLRPEPFYVPLAIAVVGLGLSAIFVRDTEHHVARERTTGDAPPLREVFTRTTLTDRTLSSASQAGLVNNLNDGLAWGLFPLLWAGAGLDLRSIGILAAIYPAVWGLGQLATGPLSDRFGRRPLIASGMALQAVALWWISTATTFGAWAGAGALLGVGTAMVYPALLAAVGDAAAAEWRGQAVGVYRLWRDLGFAFGAIAAGILGDRFGFEVAIQAVAALTLMSGLVAQLRMPRTIVQP